MQQQKSFSPSIKVITIMIFALLSFFLESGYSQPIFGYRYQNTLTSNSGTESEIIRYFDGGIVGINLGTSNSDFTLFKLSTQGNMEWKKQIVFPYPNVSGNNFKNLIALNDSNFVVIKEIFAGTFDFVVVKFNYFGNVIWARSYWGMNTSNSHLMTAFGQHGFVVSDKHQIAFVNENGNITKSFAFSNQIEIKGLSSTDNYKIKVFGTSGVGQTFAIFDIDSTGIITNGMEYSLSGYSLVFGQEQNTKAPNGGTFSMSNIDEVCNAPTGLGVFHLDSLNQLVWAKKISCAGQFPSNIIAAENGCMITANNNINWPNSVPMIYKLDSTGYLEWMKVPGDPSIPMFNYQWISSIIPDSGNGWYCVMKKNNLHFFHLDSILNGLCASQNFTQTVSDITCTGNSFFVTDSLVFMTDSLFQTTQVASSWFQYDACTGVLIDSLSGVSENFQNNNILQIFPNPSYKEITVTVPENFTSGIISIFNSTGLEVFERPIDINQNNKLDIQHLKAGFYTMRFVNGIRSYSGKLIIYD